MIKHGSWYDFKAWLNGPLSATEAKANLSSLINWAIKNSDEVVVESRGKPKAVILSYELADRFSRVVIEEMVEEGKIKYQRD